ncbi:MAG TPA: BA14K family protein [Mycoplana sp.]|jgi:hypothetical protein|nr:BA14K family protein [Mycoplana sp.]
MTRQTALLVPTVVAVILAAPAPVAAIDVLSPRNGPVAVGEAPPDVLTGQDPVDALRNRPVYRGQRGYRTYRDGYYRYNGYWYPRWIFGNGELLGDTTVGPYAPVYGMTRENWCATRYRSYRLTDNTYLPRTGGPRVQCVPQ